MKKPVIFPNKYRDYEGSIEYSREDQCFFGKILYVPDLILYEGTDLENLEAAFHSAVDEYIQDLKEAHRPVKGSCKGTFNVRTSPQIHSRLVQHALRTECSLNQVVNDALIRYLTVYAPMARSEIGAFALKENKKFQTPTSFIATYSSSQHA